MSAHGRTRTLTVATLATVALAAVAACGIAAADDAETNEHSAFTREQLRTGWPDTARSEILLPLDLPEPDPDWKGGEPVMGLVNVVTDRDVDPDERVWTTYFDAPVFDDPGIRIFQRPLTTEDKACGPMGDVPHVDQIVAGSRITICSTRLASNDAERAYWESVVFVADLGRITWLDD